MHFFILIVLYTKQNIFGNKSTRMDETMLELFSSTQNLANNEKLNELRNRQNQVRNCAMFKLVFKKTKNMVRTTRHSDP